MKNGKNYWEAIAAVQVRNDGDLDPGPQQRRLKKKKRGNF